MCVNVGCVKSGSCYVGLGISMYIYHATTFYWCCIYVGYLGISRSSAGWRVLIVTKEFKRMSKVMFVIILKFARCICVTYFCQIARDFRLHLFSPAGTHSGGVS